MNISPHSDTFNIEQTILDLQALGERKSWSGQRQASEYIQSRLEKMGLHSHLQHYSHNNKNWENICVNYPGTKKDNYKILVVAHYDSTSRDMSHLAPGADDNASGVAVVLELARLLQQEKLQHNLQLLFFPMRNKVI